MTDRLFTDCCYGSDQQHTAQQPCPQDWRPIKDAPFQTVIEVRNSQMIDPVLATRGYMTDAGMHPDDTCCTSEFTPHPTNPFPAGRLVCPTEFRLPPDAFGFGEAA